MECLEEDMKNLKEESDMEEVDMAEADTTVN